jgi:hypothetical protein
MRKIYVLFIALIVSVGLISCGAKTKNEEPKESDTKASDVKKESTNEKSLDGLKYTVLKVSKEAPIGDMNADMSYNEKGEYFQTGLTAKKVSDYDYVVIDLKVENTTDKAVKLFQTGWYATAADGYEFKDITVTDKLNNEQVPSKYSFEAKVKIPVEKSLNLDKINLKYNLKDYSDLGAAMEDATKGMSKSDIQKKYSHLYKDNFIEFGTLEIK